MKPLLPIALSLVAFPNFCSAQTPASPTEAETAATVAASTLQTGEMALEGEIKAFNNVTGEVTLLASAFATATGSKPLTPPKSKALMTTKDTLFIDRRLGTAYTISDLDIGLQVRVVGRDGGTGKPMKARILEWQSKEAPLPPDSDTPAALNGLLPPPKDSKGVKVRVVDAGFQPENRIFGWSNNGRPVFFVTYRILAPGSVQNQRPFYEWGKLKELRLPDGKILYSSGTGSNIKTGEGLTQSFDKVNPKWKSVTAVWETTSPDARADSSGRFRGQFELKGELPTREKPKSQPGTQVKTPHGTTLTLQSIECNWEKKTTTYTIAIQKPADTPDASISADVKSITDDHKRNMLSNAYQTGASTQISLAVPSLPEQDAAEAQLTLEVTEQAESWKQKGAYNTVEIEIPVAALVKANPPVEPAPPRTGADKTLPVWEAQNDFFSARIESSGSDQDSVRGVLWVAAKPKPGTEAATEVETSAFPTALRARFADGKDRDLVLFPYEADDVFFHSDGKVPMPGEMAIRFNENGGPKFGPETALSLDVRSFKRLKYQFAAQSVAVTPNTQSALDTPVGDGPLKLRKVAWLDAAATDKIALRTGGALNFKGKTGLLLVFSRPTVTPDSKIQLNSVTMRDSTGKTQETSWASWKGDALSGETEGAWTVVLPPPADGAKSLDIYLNATETGPDEQTSTIVFPNIKLY